MMCSRRDDIMFLCNVRTILELVAERLYLVVAFAIKHITTHRNWIGDWDMRARTLTQKNCDGDAFLH